MAARGIYEFGSFRLNPGRRRLEKMDGNEAVLGAKAFDVLIHLIEHAGEPVPRRALIAALWPDTIVEENNLTQAVSTLRRVLGDGYIVTLPRRGYQFVGDVRRVADAVSRAADAGSRAADSEATLSQERAGLPEQRWEKRLEGTEHDEIVAHGTPEVLRAQPRKVLVLPFESLSNDPQQQYFADGLTDVLIVALQRLPRLDVTGRPTSFAYRRSRKSAAEIAAELGVQYVFAAGVGHDGVRLRVRGQLSDASGFGVWPYSYDGPLESVFEMQDQIVSSIATNLRATLNLDQALGAVATGSFEAYQLYLEAKIECVRRKTPERLSRPRDLIERAVEIDPGFAMAWVLKTAIHSIQSQYLHEEERQAELAAADAAARRATRLAPDGGEGYSARALVHGIRRNWIEAERDYRTAHDLGFADSSTYHVMLLSAGRLERARKLIDQSLLLDPLNGNSLGFLMAAHEMLGDRNAADEVHRRGAGLFDPWYFGDIVYDWIRLGRGEVEPIAADPSRMGQLFERFAQRIDDPERGRIDVHSAASEPQYQNPVALATLAIWAAYFRSAEPALRLLERATIGGSGLLMYLAWLPLFDDVRRLPAFTTLLADIGLVDYWRAFGWPRARPLPGHVIACSE